MKFETPEILVAKFDIEDVITTSGEFAPCEDETTNIPCEDESWE